ncbi:MAG TPA: acyl-CoA thioesterase [Spirochaetia bacterium]|nr:acyl-CoA thioesterase [Spirochaetia bacterium]
MISHLSHRQPDSPGLTARYRHAFEIRVRYDDIDTFGHVNNKSYLTYLEDARIDYYRTVLGIDLRTLQFSAVVRRIEIAYESPIYLSDAVHVYVRCSRIGKKSADFEAVVTRTESSGSESIAATSLTTMVAIDPETGVSREWDVGSVKAIEAFETVTPLRGRAGREDNGPDRGNAP